ncbi:MAG: TIGR02099 family protein [Burkholderiaceae bacterium]|nr:TIGR02099 family protein [Burkholderiaceae bacterium]
MPSSRLLFDDESLPLPRASRWRALWRLSFALVLAAWSLGLLAWLTLHWGILPNARAWLPQIEAQASRALGVPVRIGDLRVRSSGWVPAFELDDVVLLDDAQREVLRLPRVAAAPAASSLFALELRLQQLLVDGAELEVRRDVSGAIRVAGFALDAGTPEGDGVLLDTLLRQREIVLRGARVRWVDEQRAAPPLELHDVDLVVRNGLRSHELRLDATPPAGWGERFSLRGRFASPLLARGDDWRRWSGSLYAELPRVDAGRLADHLALPFEWRAGVGALRAWVDLAPGGMTAATVDVAARDVALRLAPDLEPLALRELGGRVAARRDERAWTVEADDFGFVDDAGRRWPAGDWRLTLRQRGTGAPIDGGELSADRVDLALTTAVARRLPLGAAASALLDDLRAAGVVEPLALRWEGPPDAPTRYDVQATVRGLAIAPRAPDDTGALGRPGLAGATIVLDADERGGRASVGVERGALVLPGVLERPELPLDRFAATFAWRVARQSDGGPPAVELNVSDASFSNADTRGSFDAVWRTGAGDGIGRGARFPGRLELQGRLDAMRAGAVARYLPLGLPEATRRYVERAVRGGRISNVRLRVAGDLWDFPFATDGDGAFRVTGRAEGVDLAYIPDEPGWVSPWPAFTRVAGDLEFDRASMAVRNGVASVYGLELSGVSATIADMVGDPVLQLSGVAQGPANDLLRYLATSPVGGWLDGVLVPARADGDGRLQLAIRVPLDDAEASTVGGVLTLAGNTLTLGPALPALDDVRGEFEFTERRLAWRGVRARVFGGEATFDGGTEPDGTLRVVAAGRARAEALRTQTPWPMVAHAAAVLAGEADYRLQLDWGDDAADPHVDVTSDLVGVAIELPPPLAKAADEPLPLRLRIAPLPASPPRWRDTVELTLGTRLQAHVERAGEGERVEVRAGGLGVGEPAPRPERGVAARLRIDEVDLGAWLAAAGSLGGGAGGDDDAQAYLPRQVDLRAGAVQLDARRLTGVALAAQRAADGRWRARVDADQLAGELEWRPGRGDAAPGGVRARLARLHLPRAEDAPGETRLEPSPATVPALDVVIDDFRVGGRELGRLEVEAVNRPIAAAPGAPEAHEWQLNRLRLENPAATFAATGRWRPAAGTVPARMAADFRLELDDSGALLARLGMPGALRGGRGELAGDVAWQGSPLAPHAPTMNGQLRLALRQGRFLQADSGAARLLSVLSLQALPRRLTLDFRDVFEQGFEFDEASGDVTITDGVARTNNLRMRGLQAGVLMEGEADLARETQDLRVIVVPEINAGTASLLYSIINPVIGLGTFAAQLFLRQPLAQAGTREFHVTGTWDDPKVERVERAAVVPPPNPTQ